MLIKADARIEAARFILQQCRRMFGDEAAVARRAEIQDHPFPPQADPFIRLNHYTRFFHRQRIGKENRDECVKTQKNAPQGRLQAEDGLVQRRMMQIRSHT